MKLWLFVKTLAITINLKPFFIATQVYVDLECHSKGHRQYARYTDKINCVQKAPLFVAYNSRVVVRRQTNVRFTEFNESPLFSSPIAPVFRNL